MIIERLEPLARSYEVEPGDRFILSVDNVRVHEAEITCIQRITHWALIRFDHGLAYVIGDEGLEAELRAHESRK